MPTSSLLLYILYPSISTSLIDSVQDIVAEELVVLINWRFVGFDGPIIFSTGNASIIPNIFLVNRDASKYLFCHPR